MHRRRFALLTARSFLGLPLSLHHAGTLACDVALVTDPKSTPAPDKPIAIAGTRFRWASGDDLRIVSIRVRQWKQENLAASYQVALMTRAGPDLAQAEIYSSEPIAFDVPSPAGREGVALVGWTTIAGVAAYETGHAVLTVRRGPMLWDAAIAAASLERAVAFAVDLVPMLLDDIPPCSLLEGFLPDLDEMPAGATEEPYPVER